jgi:hypothetical protein
MEHTELRGIWWIPDQESRLSGTLSLSDSDGLIHEGIVIGGSFAELADFPVMWGTTTEGRIVTLQDCEHLTSWANKGVRSFRCRPSVAYIGDHFAQTSTACFRRAEVSFSRLLEWASIEYFEETVQERQQPGGDSILSFHFRYPEPIEAQTAYASISLAHSLTRKGWRAEPLVLTPSIYFDVVCPEPLPFERWLSQIVRPLQNLITFATLRPNGISELYFYPAFDPISPPEEISNHRPIQVLFHTFNSETAPTERLWRMDGLFTLPEVMDQWADILERWLELAQDLGYTFDAFFATDYSDSMYLEHKFLTLVQVAESFHRRRYKGKRLPKQEHRRKVHEIVAAVPEEYRNWIRGLLQTSNEPSLLLRLQDLVQRTQPVVAPLLPDVSTFPQRVRDLRNELTHQTGLRGGTDERFTEIMDYTYVLSVIVRTCILLELGINIDRCVAFFHENRRYRAHVEHAKTVRKQTK